MRGRSATAGIVGHERVVPIDQMIAMGYDREHCIDHIQSQQINDFTMEAQLRNPGRFMSTRVGDGVLYGEWYIKVDKNGDGQPELRYICTMGEDHEIVSDEEANRIKFALFCCDPISHTIVGDSIADYTEDIQKIKTNMMRGDPRLAGRVDQSEDRRQRTDGQPRRRAQRRSRRGHPDARRSRRER